jgi:hypothetical protein
VRDAADINRAITQFAQSSKGGLIVPSLPDRWRDVQDHNINQRTLKSSEECLIEIRKDILDLQKDGYLTDIIAPALPAPKKKPNGR